MAASTNRRGFALPIAAATATVGAAAWWLLSPRPAALLIRAAFVKGARDAYREMQPHVPTGISAHTNISYGSLGFETAYDVFRPKGERRALPMVVWIHGGAWISTSKRQVAPYLRMLAGRGFAAVGVNYSLAPERRYPTAIHQVNAALADVVARAARLGLDPDRIVLAGDSAGAQLASQLAALITNPAYAADLGITPAIEPRHLRGIVLHCGIYDFASVVRDRSIAAWGFHSALWAYTGDRDWPLGRAAREMSTIDAVTSAFPPTFISGGNGDPLTDTQSRPMADRLEELGVPVTAMFFDPDHEPPIPHEYQFHFRLAEARDALEATVEFLGDVTGRP